MHSTSISVITKTKNTISLRLVVLFTGHVNHIVMQKCFQQQQTLGHKSHCNTVNANQSIVRQSECECVQLETNHIASLSTK